ncbi:predicted protein [Arabidopsis lyrata subsp. lyrata]|uniref:Predicted protein n=1 Tax=Arabidopsis lyrata subsp. lyrata TaxID=81972 RepID=D7LGX5_ARALL|nr:predicted protein [Arabidopsis lyrata subsp. lyrata]
MMSLGSTNIKPIVEKECCHVLADTNIEPIVEKECCHVLGDTNIEPIMEKECCHELGDTNFDLITRKRVPIGLGNENSKPIGGRVPFGDSSDNSVIPSEHVRLMLKGLESESFMATSPSVTSVESISTREMDIVETSVESDKVVPLVDLGGNLGSVSVSDFVVLSDDSVEDFSDEFEESEEQMATGYLYGDVDAPMWEGPDGVKYELTSDDSGQPAVYANSHPPLPDKWSTLESFGSLSLEPDFAFSDVSSEETDSRSSDYIVFLPTEYGIPRQALAYNMVPPSKVFATPPGPPSPDFVELSLDNELADAEESVMELLIPNFVKAESLRMSTPPRRFATQTWYPGYHGTPVWRERVFRSADGTFVPTMECEDGLMSEPLRMTPFCFTCGQDGHYPRTCPYVHRYHPYARPYVVCFECGDDGHYASVCPRKYPKNPGSSSPSPSASARKLKGNLSTY